MADESMEKVTIGGQEYIVPASMAKAMQAQQAQFEDELNRREQQFEQERSQISQQIDSLKPKPPEQNMDDDMDDLDIWSDPKGYIKKETERVRNEVKQELTEEQQRKEDEKEFWNLFYQKNEDLKGYELIVNAILSRDINEIAKMKVQDAITTLADRVRKEMLQLNVKPAKNEQDVVVEDGAAPTGNFEQEAKPDKNSKSLSDLVKDKRKARQAG